MRCDRVRPEFLAFARNELPPEREAAVREHLEGCERCSARLQEIEGTVSFVYALGLPQPPEDLKVGVMAAVEAARVGETLRYAVPALPDPLLRGRVLAAAADGGSVAVLDERRPWNRFTVREMVLVAAAVVAIAFAVVSRMDAGDVATTPRRDGGKVAQPGEPPDGHDMQSLTLAGASGEVDATLTHYRHDNFRLTLEVENLPVTPAGHQYAVWLTGTGGDVPLGGFRLKREDRFFVNFAIAVDPAVYPTVLVTLEPDDGDPRLTGDILLEGTLDTSQIHHGAYDD